MPERWLVLSHQATNSGAPRMLLTLLRAMRARRSDDWECETLFDALGPIAAGFLKTEFAALGRVRVLMSAKAERGSKWARLIDRCVIQPRRLASWRRGWRRSAPAVIFANTAATGRLLRGVASLGRPVITHVHELEYSLRRLVKPADLATVLQGTNHFLAVSRAVMADLKQRGVPEDKVTRVPNFLPSLPPLPDVMAAREKIRERYGLPREGRIVSGCGHIDPLKGADRFLEVAAACRTGVRPVTFLWAGGEVDRSFAARLRSEVRCRALEDVVQFVGPVADADLLFAASEVVLVPSRVESFSRVALEAGALGRPVLAFAEARGPGDLLETDTLLPEPEPAAMAMAVKRFMDDVGLAAETGRRLRERIGREFVADRWLDTIESVVEAVHRA